jgi:hypothetical protein
MLPLNQTCTMDLNNVAKYKVCCFGEDYLEEN